jgi:Fic family protein
MKEIDKLKKELDSKQPLPPSILKKLRDHLIVEWTYHSNSIEGNRLTLNETKVVLQDGITIQGKSVKEHLEVINHKEAILFLLDLLKEKQPFSERDIKDIHNIILRGIDRENAGRYRMDNVIIVGAAHTPQIFCK